MWKISAVGDCPRGEKFAQPVRMADLAAHNAGQPRLAKDFAQAKEKVGNFVPTFSDVPLNSTCPRDRLPPALLVVAPGLISEDQRGGRGELKHRSWPGLVSTGLGTRPLPTVLSRGLSWS